MFAMEVRWYMLAGCISHARYQFLFASLSDAAYTFKVTPALDDVTDAGLALVACGSLDRFVNDFAYRRPFLSRSTRKLTSLIY